MKRFMKRFAGMLLMLVLVVGTLAACNKGGTDNTEGDSSKSTEKVEHTSANGITTSDNGVMRTELTALELTKLMGNGINLGNTMEAYGKELYGTDKAPSVYETAWSQPVTTQEMLTSMKEAGFDSIRVPIAWTNTMNYEDGDYTISEDYLNRIEEIINYALNAEMYVIINDHWDGGWWGMFGSKSQETREKAMEMYTSMWTQIAERYKEYSDYLIFESGNEELGNRLNDKIDGKEGVLTQDECYEMTNKINQKFVDVVRGTGGNNEKRFLLIAGYNTNIVDTCDNRFVMPTDTAESKLLVSVHYYDPSGYCINTSLSSWGTTDQFSEMNSMLKKMCKFTSEGYGVIIGEYAVQPDGKSLKDGALEYYENFLCNCEQYNFCGMLWNTNDLFLKDGTGFIDKDMASLYKEYSYSSLAAKSEDEVLAAVQATKKELEANAKASLAISDDKAVAWLMYNSSDWSVMYCSQDTYDPTQISTGLVATDVEITGAGTYTVALDFTGTSGKYANSVVFSAIGIANGETLYPGYYIEIKSVKINGEEYTLTGKPYTTSDDKLTTRVNLYNSWVTKVPEEARCADGDTSNVTPCVLDAETLGNVETIEVTFEYVAP